MKRLLYLLLVVGSLALLSGCGTKQSEIDTKIDNFYKITEKMDTVKLGESDKIASNNGVKSAFDTFFKAQTTYRYRYNAISSSSYVVLALAPGIDDTKSRPVPFDTSFGMSTAMQQSIMRAGADWIREGETVTKTSGPSLHVFTPLRGQNYTYAREIYEKFVDGEPVTTAEEDFIWELTRTFDKASTQNE